jgi:YidC/Oxa1 family membrane protein insertase
VGANKTSLEQADVEEKTVPKAEVVNPSREITVQTPLYTVRLNAKGASFTSYVLSDYRESVEKDSANKQLISPGTYRWRCFYILLSKLHPRVERGCFFTFLVGGKNFGCGFSANPRFRWVGPDGIVLTKTYTFDPVSYLIDLKFSVNNRSERTIEDQLVVTIRKPVEEQKGYGFTGPSALMDDKLVQVKTKKIEDKNVYDGNIKWVSIEDRYFLSSIIPATEVEAKMKLDATDDTLQTVL